MSEEKDKNGLPKPPLHPIEHFQRERRLRRLRNDPLYEETMKAAKKAFEELEMKRKDQRNRGREVAGIALLQAKKPVTSAPSK